MDKKIKTQFINYFTIGIKNETQLKIGVEHERFLFVGKNKKRISYTILKQLFKNLEKKGWEPIQEKENIVNDLIYNSLVDISNETKKLLINYMANYIL